MYSVDTKMIIVSNLHVQNVEFVFLSKNVAILMKKGRR